MASLVVTKENFISMIPEIYSLVEKHQTISIDTHDDGANTKEAKNKFHSGDRIDMNTSEIDSSEKFINFVNTHG